MTCAAEHVDELMTHAFGDERSAVAEVLTGIEVRGVLGEVFAHRGGEGETKVGVDVYLADRHGRRFAEHVLGNALSAGHRTAEVVDHLYVVGEHRARAVENDGELGQERRNLFENIETELSVALEFERAVARAYGYRERVDARLCDEFRRLVGICVERVGLGDLYVVLDARLPSSASTTAPWSCAYLTT